MSDQGSPTWTAAEESAMRRALELAASPGVPTGPNPRVGCVLLDDDGRTVAGEATVWTAGFGVPALAAASGLTTDGIGRLVTDETLTSVDDERIVAAGDASAPSGQPFRMSCQAGLPLGAPGREYSSPTCETGCTTLDKTQGTERPRREPFNTFLILKDGDSKVWWRH